MMNVKLKNDSFIKFTFKYGLEWLAEESLHSLISRQSHRHLLKNCSVELKTAL